ncbi:MAG: fatty acid oxidation complex subunit alpha FadB [Gammaproteobacteria bacterium]|nr:MAG: fatty acid oxidation complex subunit alpha FadB [Gammaproteobacteria bacterium]
MLFKGKALELVRENDVLELRFDRDDNSVNVFDRLALNEFGEALEKIEVERGAKGLILTSGKRVFVAGADINEFLDYFAAPEEELAGMLSEANGMFNRLEDLPMPTVAAINGEAQGGGCEVSLACDFRVMADSARIGLPEVKLGIMPGWGGSVRLPRMIGIDNALEWMATGSSNKAVEALRVGVADAVVSQDDLRNAALDIVEQVAAGKLEFLPRRERKKAPVMLNEIERTMAIESARGVIGAKAGPHYPAPLTIVETVEKHATRARDEALPIESAAFVKLAMTDVAESLVSIFLKDQKIKRIAKGWAKQADEVGHAAVLGAGIMGGGVAFQSASSGVPILMKDIREEALEDGLEEAGKILAKQVQRGMMKAEDVAKVLGLITPVLTYVEFDKVDLVVEAVVENAKIKQSVLAEAEAETGDDAIITTNTSTISVNLLAEALKNPANFCGMHFFNPVHRMPLVEIIRANTSSDKAIATVVAYAQKMRKTPIVVNDCPGFLVNRILFAYFGGFSKLIGDGGDFIAIDKALERFGWPMGPAYLMDVIGMDTGKHATDVMAEGFPDRMASEGRSVIDALFEAERLGQKNGKGFYRYEPDRKGKPQKHEDDAGKAVVAGVQPGGVKEFSPEEIVDRLMIPMCIEAVRCLEDNIVGTAAEVDMGLVYGVGFPPFRGGALHYIDKMGVDNFVARADALKDLGPLYHPTEQMREMAQSGATYHGSDAARSGDQS